MKVFADVHTHTVYSHGKGTIEENILAAIDRGLDIIAIAEHGPGQLAYGVRGRKLERYFDELDRMKIKYADRIKVLTGIEANILSLDGDVDLTADMLKRLDIIILGYHKSGVSRNFIKWLKFFPLGFFFSKAGRSKKQRDKNTLAFMRAIDRYPIDIIAHPNRVALMDMDKLSAHCAKRGVVIEINNKDLGYSREEIMISKKNGARFIMNSDAHHPSDVGNVEGSIARALEAGLDENDIVNACGTSSAFLWDKVR